MQVRAILAVVLCFLVFLVFTYFGNQYAPKPTPPSSPEKKAEMAGPPSGMPPGDKPKTAAPASAKPAREPRQVVVETDLYRAVFTEEGAALKSFQLKNFKHDLPFGKIFDFNLGPVGFEIRRFRDPAQVKPPDKELVTVAADLELPLSLTLEGSTLKIPSTLFYEANATSIVLKGGDSGDLVFRGITAEGLEVTRTHRFKGNSYAFELQAKVSNRTPKALEGDLKLALTAKSTKEGPDAQSFLISVNQNLEEIPGDKAKEAQTFPPPVNWAGIGELYFMTVAVPQGSPQVRGILVEPQPRQLRATLSLPQTLSPGQDNQAAYSLYFGPKDAAYLAAVNLGLEKVINFGWFDILARPILLVLKWINGWVHNYGWSLVILTILLRLLFWYPNHKSFKSMKVMQKIQPRVTEIREKFKDDKEAMNRELMNLYRTFKVNPLGGCLPMVIQLPVFVVLYNILSTAIEMRHAPFINTLPFTDIVWLADLSAKDPLLITPLLMGASMFIQQKMSPSMGDPTQAKMMMFLPIVFTFLFLNFAAGLVIYWLVNNILAIIQQHYTNKYLL